MDSKGNGLADTDVSVVHLPLETDVAMFQSAVKVDCPDRLRNVDANKILVFRPNALGNDAQHLTPGFLLTGHGKTVGLALVCQIPETGPSGMPKSKNQKIAGDNLDLRQFIRHDSNRAAARIISSRSVAGAVSN